MTIPRGVEVTHRAVVNLAEELGEDQLVQHRVRLV